MNHSPIPEIVGAVADAKSVDPNELDATLQEHVETDAIRLLAAHEDGSWTLSFEFPEHKVAVTSDGAVLVDGRWEEFWA